MMSSIKGKKNPNLSGPLWKGNCPQDVRAGCPTLSRIFLMTGEILSHSFFFISAPLETLFDSELPI